MQASAAPVAPAVWMVIMFCLMPIFAWAIRTQNGRFLYIAPVVLIVIGIILIPVTIYFVGS